MKPVNERPPLPQAIPGTFAGLLIFTADLTKQLISILGEYGFRLNRALPKDGTEAMSGPLVLASYAVADLPDASAYAGALIYVPDGTSNKRLAVSDGTDWRFPDGNVVS